MIKELMYIECKSGYNDDGPAWIGYVKTSRTYRTIYFNVGPYILMTMRLGALPNMAEITRILRQGNCIGSAA